MSAEDGWRVRLSAAWVRLYTRNAPPEAAEDRTAEMASDVFEQVDAARRAGSSESQLANAVLGRAVRGVPADLAWRMQIELQPGRLAWHVDHPATVLCLSLVLLGPLGFAADQLRDSAHDWRAAGMVGMAVVAGYTLVSAFGIVSLARWHAHHLPGEPISARRIRRVLSCALGLCWSLSGIWRFAPQPLNAVSTVAWVGFGLALVSYAGSVVIGSITRTRTDISKGLEV